MIQVGSRKRFWDKVIKSRGCWGWKASVNSGGYGQMIVKINGKSRPERAHRISWRIHRGTIPLGKVILHKCDNRLCSNPKHLMLGTPYDNVHDALKKEKLRMCNSKLTANQVREIRRVWGPPRPSYQELSRQYKVTAGVIGCVIRRDTWKHLE